MRLFNIYNNNNNNNNTSSNNYTDIMFSRNKGLEGESLNRIEWSGEFMWNNETNNNRSRTVVKRAVKVLIKQLRQLDPASWGTTKTMVYSESDEEDEENAPENDMNDLLELLEYLTLKRKLKQADNQTSSYLDPFDFDEYDAIWSNNQSSHNRSQLIAAGLGRPPSTDIDEFELPVALVQLSIIVLVFLIVLCMCKCNEMMEWCRDCRHKQNGEQKRQLDEDRYHDKLTFRDYFCFLWYNFKKRRRFNKRRKRRLKNMKNGRFNRGGRFQNRRGRISGGGGGGGGDRDQGNSRKNSLIFKRRSAIYRNKHRKTTTPTAAASGSNSNFLSGIGAGEMASGSSGRILVTNQAAQLGGSNFPSKRSVKFQPNAPTASYSQAALASMTTNASPVNATYNGDDLNAILYGATMSTANELSNVDMARLNRNLSIYFENQIEDIV